MCESRSPCDDDDDVCRESEGVCVGNEKRNCLSACPLLLVPVVFKLSFFEGHEKSRRYLGANVDAFLRGSYLTSKVAKLTFFRQK